MRPTKAKKEPSDALLDAFIELIGTIGAHQVTLQKAAKKAKVPFSTAHYYYGGDWNKIFEDAMLKVLKTAQDYTSQYIQKNSTSHSNPIELYVDATFEWVLSHPHHAQLWLFNYYSASIHPKNASAQESFIQHARQRVLNLCFEAKGRGFYPKIDVTPDLANTVHTIVFGLGIMAIIQNADSKKVNQIRKEAQKEVERSLV